MEEENEHPPRELEEDEDCLEDEDFNVDDNDLDDLDEDQKFLRLSKSLCLCNSREICTDYKNMFAEVDEKIPSHHDLSKDRAEMETFNVEVTGNEESAE